MGPRTRALAIVAFAATALAALGIVQAPAGEARRTVYMSAIEYKGGANVSTEAYPPAEEPGTRALGPLGGGYLLKEPDATGRWEVESYRWEPGFVAVELGERVKLEIVGINGARHDAHLVSPSGVEIPFVVTRGRMTIVRFHANEAGIWTLHCGTHQPGMTAEILVLG
jgi:plastocyanin